MRLLAFFLALSVAACGARGAGGCSYSSSSIDQTQQNQDVLQHNLGNLQQRSNAARMMGIAAGARP
jgi:hypothetical protein